MITIADYFTAHDAAGGDLRERYPLDMTPELERNAERMVAIANRLLTEQGRWYKVASGWRPPAYNAKTPGASARSLHMTCQAIDLADADGDLDDWCMSTAGEAALVKLGLWHEHPSSTRGVNGGEAQCHVQTRPPRSGNRHFYK